MGHESKVSVGDISQLLELVSQVAEQSGCSPSEAIQRISRMLIPGKQTPGLRQRAALAEFVARLRRLRMRRNEIVGAPLFRDPAWDMLLELFATHEAGRDVSVSSLCYASGVPQTTALRQISRLEKHGLIEREGDRRDNRRCLVRPTAKAIKSVSEAAAMFIEQSRILRAGNGEGAQSWPAAEEYDM